MVWSLLLSLLLVGAVSSSAASGGDIHEFDVQHSLDGGKTFSAAGTIQPQLDSSNLELVRTGAPALQQLSSLIEQDGFYIIRVPTGKTGRFASASVRASCLAAAPQAEKLALALDDAGHVLSVSYGLEGLHDGACKPTAAPAIPSRSIVTVQQPDDGPTVLSPQIAQEMMSSPMFSGDGAGPARSGGGGPTDRPRGAPRQAPGPAGESAVAAGEEGQASDAGPPPEEKTWLQKNWLVVAGVSMAIVNLLGNLAKQSQQPPAAAAGAAVARAAPRR